MKIGRALFAIMAGLFAAGNAAAAVLVVDGSGNLLGADDVDVNGTLYDVRFEDSSCALLFSGCDNALDFTFTTEMEATAASQALIDQVFLDSSLGNFDSDATLTVGCTTTLCGVEIPYALSLDMLTVMTIGAANSLASDFTFADSFAVSADLTGFINVVYGVFSPSDTVSEVPLPAAFPLFLAGIVGLRLVQRRTIHNGLGALRKRKERTAL